MNNCRKCRSMMSEALYHELSAEQNKWFIAHVNSCSQCSAEFSKIKHALDLMDQRTRTEPDASFWDNYWDNLSDKLEVQKSPRFSIVNWLKNFRLNLNFDAGLVYRTAGAVAILIIGIFIGKFYFSSSIQENETPFQTTIGSSSIAQQTALEQRTDHYIQRSKVLLLGLINFDPENEDPYVLNLPYQKKISQNLVDQAAGLKQELNDPSQQQLKQLVADLELILLQIANLESANDISAIEMVKSGVDRKGILLKINLEEMQNDVPMSSKNSKDKI